MRYTCFIYSLLLVLSAICCQQCTPTTDSEELEVVENEEELTVDNQESICGTVKTVLSDTAQQRMQIWKSFVNQAKLPSKWRNIKLPTNANQYTMDRKTIVRLKEMANTDSLKIDPEDPVWFMMGLSEAMTYPKLYMYTTNADSERIVFDLFSDQPFEAIHLDTAQQHVANAKNFVDNYTDIPQFNLFPYGFQFPFCDLLAIAENTKEEKDLHPVFVIKSEENEVNKKRVDLYLKVEANEAVEAENSGGGTYYDFTTSCPKQCPEG